MGREVRWKPFGPGRKTLGGKEGAAAQRTSLSAPLTPSTSDLLLEGHDIPGGLISVYPTGFPLLVVSALYVSGSPLKTQSTACAAKKDNFWTFENAI